MSQPIHTLGRGCDFAPPSSSEQVRKPCDEIPPMRAQFFYCSPLPLDDPLTALPPPTADSKNIKYPPRPFPKCDNKALLEAWLGMGSKWDRKIHNRTCRPKSGIEPTTEKKSGITGIRPKIKQEAKEFKESLKPTRPKPAAYQPTTGSATHQQPILFGTANHHQEQTAGEKEVKPALGMIGCPCKGSHLWCRKKTGTCTCTSCPKTPQDVVTEIQTHQLHASSQQTKGKQPAGKPITKSKSHEDFQEVTTDQTKHPKHWERSDKRGKSAGAKSGKESKPEEVPEPECSCSNPPEDSNLKVGKSEETKKEYSPHTESPKSSLKSSKHRRGKSEQRKPDKLEPECLRAEEDLQQDNIEQGSTDQTKRSKHWEHDCRKGRSERERSEKELQPAENAITEIPKDKRPVVTKKSKSRGDKAVATHDQDEEAEKEKTKACFDQRLRAQRGDTQHFQGEEDACCVEFDDREKKDDRTSLNSIIPSCCDENKGDGSLKLQQSEVESIFSGNCEKIQDSSSSKKKDSEAETVLSGSCVNPTAEPSNGREAKTKIPSYCDESKGNISYQAQYESPTRFGSCCDLPRQDDRQIPEGQALKPSPKSMLECCTDLERCATAFVHETFDRSNQSQNFDGLPVRKHESNDNRFENSTKQLVQNSNSDLHQAQHPNTTSRQLHKSKSNDDQSQHYSGPSEAETCVEPKVATKIQKSKGKGIFFGKRQADGTADNDDGLYDDSDEEFSAKDMARYQGDATNDKCICEPHMQKSETSIPVARHGNTYTKSGQAAGSGTTGKPFVKLPARGENPKSQHDTAYGDETSNDPQISHERDSTEDMEVEGCKAYKHKDHTKCQVDVPVGPSRLHLVTLPSLRLKPIYWSPLNDQYPCIYGTWFYRDTMCPVESAVANQLEKGYRENECWSQTWDDQLNSAIEVGPEGEEKIVHRLWPKEKDSKASTFDASEHIFSTDPYCAARCFYGEAAAEGKVEESDAKPTAATSIHKKYPNSQVLYLNSEEAFILKPSLCPSAYYGRRPLTKIKNGTCVGEAVVRGFKRKVWNKLYPSKKLTTVTKSQSKTAKRSNSDYNILDACPACKIQDEPEKVTDLCLVVHGIGQKLSERMESFNFTYAVNSFRCEMKRELTNEDVKKVLREEFCGVTVLPVNWRANLSFEDGGPRKPGDKDRVGCDYSLSDITQPTIPRVRELISDVMLDIPYYMSGHKHKMIAALIAEANRIYRLWCKNNTGFHKNGRVHLISHSLGSVMALEALSKQPTTLPAELSWRPNTKHFDFQTTNCFLAGSPCAFFLLLENKSLVPRKGIYKPGCECENGNSKDVFGEAGTFGCLAVDNLYNIMHCNDPIAYRLNACVDSRYSAGLKEAEVPDSSRSFMTAVTHAMKSAAGMSQNEEIPIGEMPRPAIITNMPSQMEMEVHDFTAEEIAEKKFCQLNENGQVDWILGNRPGMLANQYIDMLSAHSSYWNNKDFIRFLCVEIGRRSGKMNTLPNMRARKKSQK